MFVKEKAERVVNFIQFLKLTDDFYGQPFKLLDWQRETIEEFYGTIKENGFRQYHYLYFEIPKKAGKTQLGAALGLYQTFADGTMNGEVYVVAADKENASICFNAAVSMLEQNKALCKRAKIKKSQREIIDTKTKTIFKVLSSEAYSKHGYKPTCVIFDELHAQPNRDLWDIMTFGSGSARKQPVYIVLTTAGSDPDRVSIGWEIHEKARKILLARSGDSRYLDDKLWLPKIYGLGGDIEEISKIDIYDEDLWYKCNPSLGHTIDIETIRAEANDAKQSKASERLFRWLRLNQWISVKTVGWLPLSEFDATVKPRPNLLGLKCWAGLDLSSTTDLTALVLTFPPQVGLDYWYQLYFPFITEEKMQERESTDKVPFSRWVDEGWVYTTPGRTIDYDWVIDFILMQNKYYRVMWLGIDPWAAKYVEQRLLENDINVAEIPQDIKNLSPAMKKMEKLILDRELYHDENPCARWNFGNVRLYQDINNNYKPHKQKSTGRIDIIAAAIDSVAMHELQPESEDIFFVPDIEF